MLPLVAARGVHGLRRELGAVDAAALFATDIVFHAVAAADLFFQILPHGLPLRGGEGYFGAEGEGPDLLLLVLAGVEAGKLGVVIVGFKAAYSTRNCFVDPGLIFDAHQNGHMPPATIC